MAPEVANAQYKQDYASPASDLFSLGVAGHLIVMWIYLISLVDILLDFFFDIPEAGWRQGDRVHAGLRRQGTFLGRQRHQGNKEYTEEGGCNTFASIIWF